MIRVAALLFTLLVCSCVPLRAGAPPPDPITPFTQADSSSTSCSADAECPGGSCRALTCSPLPPDPPRDPFACASDTDCLGGNCSDGRCL